MKIIKFLGLLGIVLVFSLRDLFYKFISICVYLVLQDPSKVYLTSRVWRYDPRAWRFQFLDKDLIFYEVICI